MIILKKRQLLYLTGLIVIAGCNPVPESEPTPPPGYVEVAYLDLVFEEPDQIVFDYPEIPGCKLEDLRPFGWKTVDSGLLDVRTPNDYLIQVESLYQEGFQDYLLEREANPELYESIPEMNYETFLATCNVFPDINFSQYSLLGYQAVGTGCAVTFEKNVYRDDKNKQILYELMVVEEGDCETVVYNRNLILIPKVPPDYSVSFNQIGTGN